MNGVIDDCTEITFVLENHYFKRRLQAKLKTRFNVFFFVHMPFNLERFKYLFQTDLWFNPVSFLQLFYFRFTQIKYSRSPLNKFLYLII